MVCVSKGTTLKLRIGNAAQIAKTERKRNRCKVAPGLEPWSVNVLPMSTCLTARGYTKARPVFRAGSGYMLTDESGKSKLLACQTEERQNDPECHHA